MRFAIRPAIRPAMRLAMRLAVRFAMLLAIRPVWCAPFILFILCAPLALSLSSCGDDDDASTSNDDDVTTSNDDDDDDDDDDDVTTSNDDDDDVTTSNDDDMTSNDDDVTTSNDDDDDDVTTSNDDDDTTTDDDDATTDPGPGECRTFDGREYRCKGDAYTLDDRNYCVKAPDSTSTSTTSSTEPLPLILLLHGYTGTGEMQARYFGLNELTDRKPILIVKPDGTPDRAGLRYWNAFPDCCTAPREDAPDDLTWLNAVLDEVATNYPVDPARIYLVGHSNGAFMAYNLACQYTNRFAAVLTLAGAVYPTDCAPSRPIPIAHVHGTEDSRIRWEGGRAIGATKDYGSVEDTLAFWQQNNGCTAPPADATTDDLVCNDPNEFPGDETTIALAPGCPPDAPLELWRLNGVEHIPDFIDTYWSAAIYNFLMRFTAPQ